MYCESQRLIQENKFAPFFSPGGVLLTNWGTTSGVASTSGFFFLGTEFETVEEDASEAFAETFAANLAAFSARLAAFLAN